MSLQLPSPWEVRDAGTPPKVLLVLVLLDAALRQMAAGVFTAMHTLLNPSPRQRSGHTAASGYIHDSFQISLYRPPLLPGLLSSMPPSHCVGPDTLAIFVQGSKGP